MKKLKILALFGLLILLQACVSEPGNTVLVLNPYENVDWDTVEYRLANLHTHSTNSPDGNSDPHDVIDYYYNLGYEILSITEHDAYTYPWTDLSSIDASYENRDPDALGMLAVPGNELISYATYGSLHDVNAFFSTVQAMDGDDELSIMNRVKDDNGMMFLPHPGRYWNVSTTYEQGDKYAPEWYLDLFNQFDLETLLGIEVFNAQDRHPNDRVLWDALLEESMPNRPIWGFGNDDYHGSEPDARINWSYSYHLMDELSVDAFKANLVQGAFFTAHTERVEDRPVLIDEIIVNETEKYIEIVVDDVEVIRWYSGFDERASDVSGFEDIILRSSVLVHEGNRFYYGDFEGSYVRAEVWTDTNRENVLLTQPFGFEKGEE